MHAHLCPWWLTYSFDNPLRRLLHDPRAILAPYVRVGMSVADIGCGMGYFTPTLARLVGEGGRVQAIDLQAQQLARVRVRCEKAGVGARVTLTQAAPDVLGLTAPVDFVLAFWMVHEVPEQERLLRELAAALVAGGRVLVAEPKLHVSGGEIAATAALARRLGFEVTTVDAIRFSRSVVLTRG